MDHATTASGVEATTTSLMGAATNAGVRPTAA